MENSIKKHILSNAVKFSLALALFIIAALIISGAGIIVQDGALNVSNSLYVDTSTLFVDSVNHRVGIGIANPGAKLHVVDGDLAIGETSGGTTRYLKIFDGVTSNFAGVINPGSAGLRFITNNGNTDAMAILSSGNVGIGTTSPGKSLHIKGSSGVGIRIEETGWQDWDLTATHGGSSARLDIARSSGATNIMSIVEASGGGNIGIGTTTPDQRLKVSGNANITGTVYYGALQANSPILEKTNNPFVARCTIADDGKLVVEYIHGENGIYSKAIEAVNPDSTVWYHKECFEKYAKFKYLDSLSNNSITIEDIGFDWVAKSAFVR